MASAETRRLKLWQGRIETDRAFVARLAGSNTVYAPKFPGTSRGDTEAAHALDSWLDLVVYYGELFDALKLAAPAVVGHSFGGLLAAEIAAASPKSVSRLALIDPVGLWLDDHPVQNWMILPSKARRSLLFADADGDVAKHFFDAPPDAAERVEI